MARLRRDYERYLERDAEIVVVGPEDSRAFADYWRDEGLPFVGLPDPKHTVLKLYDQQVKLLKLGRMPALVVVDKAGVARYAHYGHGMSDIPANDEILEVLDELNQEADQE
jgi:peroxiredoxin Q/BCP